MSAQVCTTCDRARERRLIPTYHDTLVGLPGGVFLHEAEEETVCTGCGERCLRRR